VELDAELRGAGVTNRIAELKLAAARAISAAEDYKIDLAA
jgi:hypothetical protein